MTKLYLICCVIHCSQQKDRRPNLVTLTRLKCAAGITQLRNHLFLCTLFSQDTLVSVWMPSAILMLKVQMKAKYGRHIVFLGQGKV